jgi:hypothetical protein
LNQLSWVRFACSWGALVGGSASLLGVIYAQRCQGRLQRAASEIAKRETVYVDFVMSASNLLLKVYTRDEISLSGDEQRLIGPINQMRLFAPPGVLRGNCRASGEAEDPGDFARTGGPGSR